ncbi:MAG: tRNA (adenosine(37)-N6)-threonylcarbamoyltransferase complex dimerization subunit type 1 TsaB [Chitinophagaceae bacterium]|nr:tRNA (adenosine(37)-N6)-threonylcarbamoyltransferase complex dimerization subunit type 1 TsaB [Chitinophagaceae bacterium]MDP1764202.1 tRNA (adenosine(37)-N6)-threonylcarbamoyltransferase complex dimerization subunit type 1 TsaB [Sediminibacterium sp.]MDP1810883.1 tRNA (adenosine(37)-N6)-threonylcarbamoyltransferase complex dimerization subunit type 1 TsaB [Sediminibacterium sp.]MDP3129000.1 tRNA (adenosine(37)-N6)-threonylcarbamoyltransferase complex dimerization subunit type 1 TsaB [Sedimin
MPLLLHIDTATAHASVCLSEGATILGLVESDEQKNHASFIQPAIQQLMANSPYSLNQLDAIAVTAGPGSYTGLRVGLASAKGICYALDKPLIMVNTLEVMAQAILSHWQLTQTHPDLNTLLCPMIDARRMEVFTAVYNIFLDELEAPNALIIDVHAFSSARYNHPMVFSGSGQSKLAGVMQHPNTSYLNIQHNASHLAIRAAIAYQTRHFANLAYAEPLYVKAFYHPSKPA